MARNSYYLPEYHNFEYIARAPWPHLKPQQDWIDNICTLEIWLEQYVGEHYVRWAWATEQDHEPTQACVAFKWDKHRTLFLLTWS